MRPLTKMFLMALLALSTPKVWGETSSEEERRLHRIYQNYLSDPVTDEQWHSLFSALQEDVYVIQPGDTLWELSLVFFGDGHYWPKLWSVNSRLTNPHLIRPGYQIRFLRGGGHVLPQVTVEPTGTSPATQLWGETAPAVRQSLQASASPLTETADGDSLYLLIDAPEIPPPMYPPAPLLEDLPDTFPDTHSRIHYDEVGFSFEGRPRNELTPTVALRSFITDEPPSSMGRVVEHSGGNELSGTLQYLYIQSQEPVRVGDRLMAFGFSSKAGRWWGKRQRIYHIYGEVEVTEETTSGDDLYRAVVLSSLDGIPTGAQLVRQSVPHYSFSQDGRVSNIAAEVMGAPGESYHDLYGLGSELYFDRGSRDGLQAGDILYITGDRSQRLSRPKVTHAPVYSAVAKIVHTGQTVATGVLVTSLDDIRKGDVTGKSRVPARVYPQPEDRNPIQYIE